MALASSTLEKVMKTLAIDTTTWSCSIALWEEDHEISSEEVITEKSQAAILPSLVQKYLDAHHVDQLLVNVGPGSFTGLRVGLAFARGLSLGLKIPLFGIDGFTATYQSLEKQENVLILIESHRQEVFAKLYLNGEPQEPQTLNREEVNHLLKTITNLHVAGSGVSSCLEGLPYQQLFPLWQGARALVHTFYKNPTLTCDAIPFYVREADVTLSKKLCTPSPSL